MIKRQGLWFRKKTPLKKTLINTDNPPEPLEKQPKIPNIVTVNVENLMEGGSGSASKSQSRIMSKNSRLSISPFHSKLNSMLPKHESMLSINNGTYFINNAGFNNKLSSNLEVNKKVSKSSSSNNDINNRNSVAYRASIVSHLEFEEEKTNFFQRTLKKTLTSLNLNFQKNFLRFFNYSKKQRHFAKKTLLKIKPKYLKLIVDYEKEIEDLSSKEVLPSRDENIKKQQYDKQLTKIKKAKLPIVYTVRKTSNVLMELLKKVQEHKGSITTEMLGSETSTNDLFSVLNKKSLKSSKSKQIVPLSTLKRKSSKNLEMLKSNKNIKSNAEDNVVLTVRKGPGDVMINSQRKSTILVSNQKGISLNNLPKVTSTSNLLKFGNNNILNIKKNQANDENTFDNKLNNNMNNHDRKSMINGRYSQKIEKIDKIDNIKKDNEKRLTKEQEVMVSLVLGKTKDVDYNFISIMINAPIENEEDDETFLHEIQEDQMDIEKQYLKIRVFLEIS